MHLAYTAKKISNMFRTTLIEIVSKQLNMQEHIVVEILEVVCQHTPSYMKKVNHHKGLILQIDRVTYNEARSTFSTLRLWYIFSKLLFLFYFFPKFRIFSFSAVFFFVLILGYYNCDLTWIVMKDKYNFQKVDASRFDFLQKIVIIGDSGVGKSNILLRFSQNSFA